MSTQCSLGEEINRSTRSLHTQLETFITARLPLTLPPQAQSPLAFSTGLTHFSRLFEAFEARLTALAAEDLSSLPSSAQQICDLALPQLLRSSLIKKDIAHLRLSLRSHAEYLPSPELPSSSPRLRKYVDHITTSTRQRPELLFAHAWVLYSTLFQGNRWIRKTLKTAGPGFWQGGSPASPTTRPSSPLQQREELPPTPPSEDDDEASEPPSYPGFSFLDLSHGLPPTTDISEDALLHRFTTLFHNASADLPPETRKEIVREATHLFIAMIMMVEELDEDLARRPAIRRIQTNPATLAEGGKWRGEPLGIPAGGSGARMRSPPPSYSGSLGGTSGSSSGSSSPERAKAARRGVGYQSSYGAGKISTTPLLEKGFPLAGSSSPRFGGAGGSGRIRGWVLSGRATARRVWDDRVLYLRYLCLMVLIFYLGYAAGKGSLMLRAEDAPSRRRA